MHPAFSVIFFTTLSGLGYGLLFWIGLQALLLPDKLHADLALIDIVLGLVLSSIGLLSSLAHLGRPERAWRALTQWRSSWLSREGVLAIVVVPAAILLAVLLLKSETGWLIRISGLLLAALALATVACTAMIYACLKPIPAWTHGLVLPVYLVFALLSGALACAAVQAERAPLWLLLALALGLLTLLGMKLAYWRAIDAQRLPEAASAVGLPAGAQVGRFEAPHTEGSYITREMAFALARRHSRRLRRIAAVMIAVAPLFGLALAWLLRESDPRPAFAIATGLLWLGALLERWLFFAEARHVVAVYYP
jgi:DMSO reductase anchor subunit